MTPSLDTRSASSRRYRIGNQSQSTPPEFFRAIDDILGPFELDAAADADNTCCPHHYNETIDGLRQEWASRTWVNPPWGDLEVWIRKALAEAERGRTVVMLCPLRCNTQYWHQLLLAYPVPVKTFVLQRGLKFGSNPTRYPHPLSLLVFGGEVTNDQLRKLARLCIRPLH